MASVIALSIAGSSFQDSGAALTQPSVSEKCPTAREGLRFYVRRYNEWRLKTGAAGRRDTVRVGINTHRCPRYRAQVWKRKALSARRAYERWREYHWAWKRWLPAKWERIAICETGLNWKHSNSSYEGAFGFAKSSWDSFKDRAARKAGPYPEDAWQATPRQQWEVALAIYRMYGLSGWGCRNA